MRSRLDWEPVERRVLREGVVGAVLIVTAMALFGGFDGIVLAALTVVTVATLLLDVHLPQGGSLPLGYALLIALAYLLPGGDYLLVVLFSVLLSLPVLHRRKGADVAGAIGMRWLVSALAAGATTQLVGALGLGGDHNTGILVCVVLGGVAFLTADLLTARFSGVASEERVDASSAWPVYLTVLSAAALLALADRFEHDGSTGSPWMAAIALCPLLISRFSFERYAQAQLPTREFILWPKQSGAAERLRAPMVDLERLRRRAEKCPAEIREQIRRGTVTYDPASMTIPADSTSALPSLLTRPPVPPPADDYPSLG